MGNANGREDGVLGGGGGGDDVAGRSKGESGMLDHAQNSRVPSADPMSSSPLQSPHRSPSPLLFAPQVHHSPSLYECVCVLLCCVGIFLQFHCHLSFGEFGRRF